jgi:hypothetical protein
MASREIWRGTAKELLHLLGEGAGERVTKERGWPRQPNALSNHLRRVAPPLRRVGIHIELGDRLRQPGTGARIIEITRLPEVGKRSSQPSQSSHAPRKPRENNENEASGRDDPVTIRDDAVTMVGEGIVTDNPLKTHDCDDGDDCDDVLHTPRGKADEPVCRRCGVPGNDIHGQLIRAGHDGAAGHFHPRCWTEERTKGPRHNKPALGPVGDSLEDLQ